MIQVAWKPLLLFAMVQSDLKPLLLFVAVAAIAAVVVLLVVPSTRRATAQSLGALAALAVLAVVGFFFLAIPYESREATRAAQEQELGDPQLESQLRAQWSRQNPMDRVTAPAPAADQPSPPASATVDAPVPPGYLPAEADPKSAPAEPKSAAVPNPPQPPAWVGAPPQIKDGVYQIVVGSGRYTTYPECQRALDVLLKRAIDEYVETRLAPELGPPPASVALDPALIHRWFVKDQFLEQVQSSVGPMHQLHALVRFDDRSQRDLRERYEQAVTRGRLEYLALGGGMVLVVLGAALAYLKLDLATHGAYRLRLQLVAVALILLAGAGLVLVAGPCR